jgi:hypothetical protein
MHERKFLVITSFLIVLIGTPAVLSVVSEPEASRSKSGVEQLPVHAVTKVELSKGPERQPATASPDETETPKKNAIHSKSVVMDYDCKKVSDVEVDGTLLRLKGQDTTCMNENWTDISITNHTNGFTASVIFLKKGFTTDFIDLNEGDNQLEIQAKDDKGQKVSQKLKIKRRSIASVEEGH